MYNYDIVVKENRYIDDVLEADRYHTVVNPLLQTIGRIRPTLWPNTKTFIFTNTALDGYTNNAYLLEDKNFHQAKSFEDLRYNSGLIEDKINQQLALSDEVNAKRHKNKPVIQYLEQQWQNGINDINQLTDSIQTFVRNQGITEITINIPLVKEWIKKYCGQPKVKNNTDKVYDYLCHQKWHTTKEIENKTGLTNNQVNGCLNNLKVNDKCIRRKKRGAKNFLWKRKF